MAMRPTPEGPIDEKPQLNRRELLQCGSHSLAALALTRLLGPARAGDAQQAARCHFAPRARRAINICLVGGLSQVDSFDYKPALEKYHGKAPPTKERPDVFFGKVGLLRKSDFRFRQRGDSGLWISDLFPKLAEVADRLTVIRSMRSETGNHTPALFLANSGFQVNGFPSVGSWLSYGLGNDAEDLPTYVVIPDARGAPSGGSSSWSSGFLPGRHQGVPLASGPRPIRDLFPPEHTVPNTGSAVRQLVRSMDLGHLERLGGRDVTIEARLRGYELAARLQLSIPSATDLSQEPEHIAREFGLHEEPTADFARSCILARRLLERGVRFVQLFSGGPLGGKPRTSWDGHEDNRANHSREALRIDRPVAALLRDLERRGLLDDTLLTFTTEFGRTPFTQSAADVLGAGRDHNNAGFTVWMAGAGLKPGIAYGSTDEIGYRAADRTVSWHDFHATVLHLFGIDHERLTHYHNGIERRLTNVHGRVLDEILG